MARVKVAVVGAGVFGCEAAVALAQQGLDVRLYDRMSDILEGTSARCQGRVHSGYHYPRSPETALLTKASAIEFTNRHPEAMINDIDQYYAIAPDGLISPDDFLSFCKDLELPYKETTLPQLRNIDLCVKVPESFVNVDVLRQSFRRELAQNKVALNLSHPVTDASQLDDVDWVVWTTYGNHWTTPLKFEICEIPVMEIGRYPRASVVVLDGEFGGIDSRGKLHSLYDVKHTVHWSWTGVGPPPITDSRFLEVINKAAVPVLRPMTRVSDMIKSLSRFFWGLEPTGQGVSIYHGSLWSVRAVLPTVDATDERPTIIRMTGNHISVLSGKICTAVTAARQITEMVMGA